MSVFDSVFGVIAGPLSIPLEAVAGRSKKDQADARGASIAAVGGVGGTAIEAAAGDDPQAIKTGVTADVILGSTAATVATLGAAAPAAGAADAAVIGGEAAGAAAADAGVTAGAAAAAPAASTAAEAALPAASTAGVDMVSGAAGATAAPVVTPTAGTAITSAAPDMITGAAPVDTMITHPAGQYANGIAANPAAEVSESASTAQKLKDAAKIGTQTYSNVKRASASSQEEAPPSAPQIKTYKPPASGFESAQISQPGQFDQIFGTPQVSGTPQLLTPNSTNSTLDPLTNSQLGTFTPPPLLQPTPPMIQMSDNTRKTKVTNADRSVQDFLNQIYGRI
jgi:hypothetical protein